MSNQSTAGKVPGTDPAEPLFYYVYSMNHLGNPVKEGPYREEAARKRANELCEKGTMCSVASEILPSKQTTNHYA